MTSQVGPDAGAYAGRAVLVTGGLGFIGSHLVHRLALGGARVRVLDSLLPAAGGSPRNLDTADRAIHVVVEDTRSRDVVDRTVAGVDYVFHLAGHAGFSALASDWYTEIDTACLGTLNLLDAVRVRAPEAHVVFASSLAVYGPGGGAPRPEDAPTEPDTLFGVHKLAGEKYCGVYHRRYGVRSTVARLATVFGPRQRLRGAANGTLPQALDAALHDEAVAVGGNGEPLLDVLHVDDAVNALLALGARGPGDGSAVNVGRGEGMAVGAVVGAVVDAVGRGRVQLRADTPVPLGNTVGDVSRLRAIGVAQPARDLAGELRDTLSWYRSPGRAA